MHAADAATADCGARLVLDLCVSHRRAHACLSAGIEGTATIGDPGFVDCFDVHISGRAGLAADAGTKHACRRFVLRNRHRGRDRTGSGRGLVSGRVDTHAKPDVDLLALVARGDIHCARILNAAFQQAGRGVVLDIAIGHATGQRCAALGVVRTGGRDRQGAADADQQGLVDRCNVQLHAIAAVVLDRCAADISLGALTCTVDRGTARQGDSELRLRRLRSLRWLATARTQQAFGLVEILRQSGVAIGVGLVGHAFKRRYLAHRPRLQRIQETGVLRILLLRQCILLVLELLGAALGNRACGSHRTRQALAAGLD